MIIKLNTTGTHIHKGLLKLRADLYPTVTDKTYALQHVYVPVIPEGATDEQLNDKAWIDALPHLWQLNPALCHSFVVPENFKLEDVEYYLRNLFVPDTWATLDNYLVVPNSIHYISPYMKGKQPLTESKVKTQDLADLIASANVKLSRQSDIELAGGGNIEPIIPASIDVGDEAIDRSTSIAAAYTLFSTVNPANADGTIDTIEIWAVSNTTGTEVGSIYLVSGTTYKIRDNEEIGSVTGGSKQTFSGRDMSIIAGDFIAAYSASGELETGLASPYIKYKSGEYIDTDDSTTYSTHSSKGTISLHGTGVETGGGPTEKTSSDSGSGSESKAFGNPVASVSKSETGSGVEAEVDYPGGEITGSESGEGSDAAIWLAVIAPAGDSGTGAEISHLDAGGIVNKVGSDTVHGVDIVAVISVQAAGLEAGSGTEASTVIPAFAAHDMGLGVDFSILFKDAYGSDTGAGEDSLKSLGGAGGKGPDMRLHGRMGKTEIPSRKTGIPSKGVNI